MEELDELVRSRRQVQQVAHSQSATRTQVSQLLGRFRSSVATMLEKRNKGTLELARGHLELRDLARATAGHQVNMSDGLLDVLQIQMTSQHLLNNLVNDLMDKAKAEKGQFALNLEYFNLLQTLREAFQIIQHLAARSGITLRVCIDHPAHLKHFVAFLGDRQRYLQMALNYLSNSLKFTPRGGQVVVVLEALQSQAELQPGAQHEKNANCILFSSNAQVQHVALKLSVVDSGRGISPEGLKRLFRDFGRLEENKQLNKQGTGLGLQICKSFVESLGGASDVKSVEGQGTQFFMTIPSKCLVTNFNSDPANLTLPGGRAARQVPDFQYLKAKFKEEEEQRPHFAFKWTDLMVKLPEDQGISSLLKSASQLSQVERVPDFHSPQHIQRHPQVEEQKQPRPSSRQPGPQVSKSSQMVELLALKQTVAQEFGGLIVKRERVPERCLAEYLADQ